MGGRALLAAFFHCCTSQLMQRSALQEFAPGACNIRHEQTRLRVRAAANVTIMGARYPLFTHVHHHYGLNDAFDRSVSALLSLPPLAGSGYRAGSESGQGAGNSSGVLAGDAQTQQARPATAHWHAEHRGAAAASQAERGVDMGQEQGGGGRAPPAGKDPAGSGGDAVAALAAAAAAEQRRAEAGTQAGSAGSVAGRRRLVADTGGGESARRRTQEAAGAGVEVGAGAGMAKAVGELEEALAEVGHPCLHEGYARAYTRMALEGMAPAPEPPRVRLVGR